MEAEPPGSAPTGERSGPDHNDPSPHTDSPIIPNPQPSPQITPVARNIIPASNSSSGSPNINIDSSPHDNFPPASSLPWASRLKSSLRNLKRTAVPTYREDGIPVVIAPASVLLKDSEIWTDFIVAQFLGGSDHSRSWFQFGVGSPHPKPFFKYLRLIADHPQFQCEIRNKWESVTVEGSKFYCFVRRLREIKAIYRTLNTISTQNIQARTKLAREELLTIQSNLLSQPSVDLFNKGSEARLKWMKLDQIEESFFKQRSRVKWLKEGDSNSKFFHRVVKARQSINAIRLLINSDGEKITELQDLKALIVGYYQSVLGSRNVSINPFLVQERQAILPFRSSELVKTDLSKLPSSQEIRDTVFRMPSNRAPGPDGFSIDFFRDTWGILGEDLTGAVIEFFWSGRLLKEINNTAITLIPKFKGADKITDFRPISCCNAIYKVISTILARKLSPYLPEMVQNNQAGFVKGRSIQENILLASELVTGFHKDSPTHSGVLKIDLAKAYDNINRDIIRRILEAINVPPVFINWIYQCISTPLYSININGELVGFFKGEKGLRQGDPLSSSLFVLVMDVLARQLDLAVMNQHIKLPRSHYNPLISHLSFADDLLVFFDGTPDSLQNIFQVLDDFYQTSILRINCDKILLFLDGKDENLTSQLAAQFGISPGILPIRYLGLPLSPQKLQHLDYSALLD